jgi:hypothetical protein
VAVDHDRLAERGMAMARAVRRRGLGVAHSPMMAAVMAPMMGAGRRNRAVAAMQGVMAMVTSITAMRRGGRRRGMGMGMMSMMPGAGGDRRRRVVVVAPMVDRRLSRRTEKQPTKNEGQQARPDQRAHMGLRPILPRSPSNVLAAPAPVQSSASP